MLSISLNKTVTEI